MLLQGGAIAVAGAGDSFGTWLFAVAALGAGTALVYPALLAAVGDAVHPEERATALGVYRFWRDAGAMTGALAAGALADLFGLEAAIQSVAALTAGSGILAAATMQRRGASVEARVEP
jgi:MFS family permease